MSTLYIGRRNAKRRGSIAALALLATTSGCAPGSNVAAGSAGASMAVNSQSTSEASAQPTRVVRPDGPEYATLDEALHAEWSSVTDIVLVTGRISRKEKALTVQDDDAAMFFALYRLEINDDLGSEVTGPISLFGFDGDEVRVIDAPTPNPEVGMSGAFVIGAKGKPGEAPYGEAYGRPYNVLMYLQVQPDGSFLDPRHPKQGPVSIDELRAAAGRAGQRIA